MTFLHQFFFCPCVCVCLFFSLLLLVQDTQVGSLGEERVAPAKDLVYTTMLGAAASLYNQKLFIRGANALARFRGYEREARRRTGQGC